MKKEIENILKKIEKELDYADDLVTKASDLLIKDKYSKRSYELYKQRYEYFKGLLMAKTIIIKEIKKFNKNMN